MARPLKKGLDYFPFDVGFFNDRAVKALKGHYGSDGITVYIYLLCLIYKENGYYLEVDQDFYDVLSDDLNMNYEKIGQIINFLCERSLFDNTLFVSDKVLTSHGIQVRFQEIVKARKKEIEVGKFWVLSENETQGFIKRTHFGDYSEKNPSYSEKNPSYSTEKPSKVKESKEKKTKEKETKVEESNNMRGADKSAPTQEQEAVCSLILNDKSFYDISQESIDHWCVLYPAVNVLQELRKMQGWLELNPTRRKTRKGITRFIANWLSRAQDKGGSSYGYAVSNQNVSNGNPFMQYLIDHPELEEV